jgi:hypothetical protein
VRIATDSNVLRKGRAWWQPPQLPAHVTLTAGPLLAPDPAATTAEMTARIEAWFRAPADADAACTSADAAVGSPT